PLSWLALQPNQRRSGPIYFHYLATLRVKDLGMGVSVTDETQPDRLVALAPNDVEVEEGPLPPRAGAAEKVGERPPVHRQQVAIAELPHDAHLGALLEPHEDVSALVLGLREEAALEESEIEDVQ